LFQIPTYPNTNKVKNGYSSYPRIYKSSESKSSIAEKLDIAFSKLKKKPITSWLRSENAKSIYEEATEKFVNYPVKYNDNRRIYLAAKKFLDGVSKDYIKLPH